MGKWINRRPKAVVFVDYEHWFYSYLSLYKFRPNILVWKQTLEAQFQIVRLEVFADFSAPKLDKEKAYWEKHADAVINTQDILPQRGKDMTDFVMLDRIYRSTREYKRVKTYILFTGDGHFRPAIRYLTEELGKRVICWGVNNAYSSLIRDTKAEQLLVPTLEELYVQYRDFIIEDLAYCADHFGIIPTFSSTVEAVTKYHGLQAGSVRQVLQKMIEDGYIKQYDHTVTPTKTVRALEANWERLKHEGLFIP